MSIPGGGRGYYSDDLHIVVVCITISNSYSRIVEIRLGCFERIESQVLESRIEAIAMNIRKHFFPRRIT